MTIHQEALSYRSTFQEKAAASAALRPSAQATTVEARRKATRPWFKKKRFIFPLALILVFLILQAVNGLADSGTVASPPKAEAVGPPGIGSKVRVGPWQFLVTGVEHPGKSFAGKAGKVLTAQGEFVIVRFDASNLGNKVQHLGYQYQLLVTAAGQKVAPSGQILLTKEALRYVVWINPGDTAKGASILFDVAPGTKAVSIELHDSASSAGVKVKLS